MIQIRTKLYARQAHIEELDRVFALWKDEMAYHAELDPDFFDPAQINENTCRTELLNLIKKSSVIVLITSPGIIGYATIYEYPDGVLHCNCTPSWEIGDFVVANNYGIGVNKTFMREIKKLAKKKGVKRIDINVHALNERMLKCCAETDFKEKFRNLFVSI
jgi:hypothetical protein